MHIWQLSDDGFSGIISNLTTRNILLLRVVAKCIKQKLHTGKPPLSIRVLKPRSSMDVRSGLERILQSGLGRHTIVGLDMSRFTSGMSIEDLHFVLLSCSKLQSVALPQISGDTGKNLDLGDDFPYPKELRRISVRGEDMLLPGAKALSTMVSKARKLEELALTFSAITVSGMNNLCAEVLVHAQVTALNFEGGGMCMQKVGPLLGMLPNCTSLRTLKLPRTSIAGEAAVLLGTGLPHSCLQNLYLTNNDILESDMCLLLRQLVPFSCLEILNLSNNDIGTTGAAMLKLVLDNCKRIKSLCLEETRLGNGGVFRLKAGRPLPDSLTKLDLRNNGIEHPGCVGLASFLQQSTNLTHLQLSQNPIGDCGATHLGSGLNSLSCLQRLEMSACNIGCEGAAYLAGAIASHNLRALELDKNRISSLGSTALAEVLYKYTDLTKLRLDANQIGDKSAISLANALKGRTTLQLLGLCDNNLADEGIGVLAENLHPASLTHVDLGNCHITAPGAQKLARLLAKCGSLKQLFFSNNRIEEEGGMYLAQGLQACTALECLYLNYCEIGDTGATSIARALAGCQSLRTISLRYCNLGAEGARSLKRAFAGSTALQVLRMSEDGKTEEFFDRLSVGP
tara:strand:- start:591 stop:2465 length:1875 start_codon:yes stop_codon:yes gene_type:complete